MIVRSSFIGDNTVLGDDSFITDSILGVYCSIERRGMVFNSKLGDYSYTGYNTITKYADIGKYCSISWNVSIGGANHNYCRISTHPFSFEKKFGFTNEGRYTSFSDPLVIGNDVWIGCNSVILRKVKIGDGAVIGASSVVTKDVPPYAIVVGNPAKILKYRFPAVVINKLLEIQWWDWDPNFIKNNISFFQNEPITLSLLENLLETYKMNGDNNY